MAARVLARRGVDLRTATAVHSIDSSTVHLGDESIEACTIVLTSGIVPNAAAVTIPVEHDRRGRIAVDGCMRGRSHPHGWALGERRGNA